MLKKIISGGQTGADIAGIDAAIALNFSYGGWLPGGRKTETGKLPGKYIMEEMLSGGYPKRTEQNIKNSSGTVIFNHGKLTGGSHLTADLAESWGKPWLHINLERVEFQEAVTILADWLQDNKIEVLNVAGSRASKDSKIYDSVFFIVSNILKQYTQ